MPSFADMATNREEKRPLPKKSFRFASPREDKKRKIRQNDGRIV